MLKLQWLDVRDHGCWCRLAGWGSFYVHTMHYDERFYRDVRVNYKLNATCARANAGRAQKSATMLRSRCAATAPTRTPCTNAETGVVLSLSDKRLNEVVEVQRLLLCKFKCIFKSRVPKLYSHGEKSLPGGATPHREYIEVKSRSPGKHTGEQRGSD